MAVDPKALAARLSMKQGLLYRWLHVLLPGTLMLGALGLRLSGSAWTEWVQNQAFDTYQRLRPRTYAPTPVRIVDIDDESLRRLGQWPWPRLKVAELIDRSHALGAAVVAFDIAFAEPDRTSPQRILQSWLHLPAARELAPRLARLPDHDKVLAEAIRRGNVVMGFFPSSESSGRIPATRSGVQAATDVTEVLKGLRYGGAAASLKELEKAAAGNASLGYAPDPDNVVRRAPLVFNIDELLFPSLGVDALRLALGARQIEVETEQTGASVGEAAGGIGITSVKVGDLRIPTDQFGRMLVHFTREAPERTLPAWRILQGELPAGALKGMILFVGTSAPGLLDLRATPLNPGAPGVEVHAQVAEQALLGHFLERPIWGEGVEVLFVILFGSFLISVMRRLGPAWCAWVALAAIGAWVGTSWLLFTQLRLLVDPIFPALTVLAVYIGSSLVSYLQTEAERRQVRSAFSRYMHPKMVEELARNPEKLKLGGETRPMTILFCDIRGFTTISEQYDAHGLTRVINRFLTPMTEQIMERRGYIDKYIGDCIMAFWNAPLDDREHAANACASALAMIRGLEGVNQGLRAEAQGEGKKFHEIHIGVGLNTGDCCVGNMGSDQRFNYSVLGDDVNLASRLEGQSKYYGVEIVIGPKTRELAPDFAAIELDLIKVKGKTRPVRIHALLGDRAVACDPVFKELAESHEAMLAAYRRQDWDEASRRLADSRKHSDGRRLDGLWRLYEGRLEAFRAAPPGEGWDGAYTATSK